MEILKENIAEYTEREFIKYFADVETFSGIAIVNGMEMHSLTIRYNNNKAIEVEGFSLSDILYKIEQIVNLLKAIKS